MTMHMQDLHFPFDPMLFPEPPSVPPSSELFSASETSDIFGFLDNFTDWDFNGEVLNGNTNGSFHPDALQQPLHPDSFGGPYPELTTLENHLDSPLKLAPALNADLTQRSHPYPRQLRPRSNIVQREQSPESSLRVKKSTSPASGSSGGSTPGPSRTKPLLDDKQKRMNHIMSEQKRRNAIRDGYAQLTTLLAPAGAPPGTGMPTRGRPKGSGSKGKSRPGAGKSGVLLRAVEYCRFLEEGRDALLAEVERLEAVAGVRVNL